MFRGITREICSDAWEITAGTIIAAHSMDITNKFAGTIVVLDPWSDEVMFQARVSYAHPEAEKYDGIALTKAVVSRETGLPSRYVQQDAPHLYLPGMTKWGGSAAENRLVVAFSGVQAVFDEAVSWTMLKWIVALCQNEMTKPDGVMNSNSSFID